MRATTSMRYDMRQVVSAVENLELDRPHWMLFFACVTADASLAALVESPIYVRLKLKDNYGIDDARRGHFMFVAFMGVALGSLCYSMVNASIGRRTILIIGLGPACLFTALQAFATSYVAFIVLRSCAGLCLGLACSAAGVYLSEFLPISHRGRLLHAYHIGYSVTALSLVLLSSYLPMNVFLGITGVPAVIGCVAFLFFLPESPRYLIASQRTQEARDTLMWLSQGTLQDDDLIVLNPQDSEVYGTEENQAASSSAPPQTSGDFASFSYNIMRVSLPWICLALSSGGLRYLFPVYISRDSDPVALVAASTSMDITGNVIAIALADTMDRSFMFILGMILSAVWSILTLSTSTSTTRILFAALQQGSQALPWLNILTLSCELFPTEHRGMAAAGTRGIELMALATSPVVAGMAAAAGKAQLAIGVYAGIYAFGALLAALLLRDVPKMVGRPMVESTKFD